MKIAKIIFFIFLAAGIASCNKEDALGNVDNISGLGGDTWVQGTIDKWIRDSLTTPFNSSVKWKYDQFETDLNRTLVPVKEENVIPILSAIRRVWINNYVAEAGVNFFKKYGNKFYVLVGSGSFDPSIGTTVLGQTAEDGSKITIYQSNYFKTKQTPGYAASDSAVAKNLFHTIEHEFAHVLHRNVKYPFAFTQVGSKFYTSDWNNVFTSEAQAEGFISSYAISQADDDFCEMVAIMLIEGKANFDKIVSSINYTGTTANGTTAAVAQSRLRQKEAIIVTYFKQVWNIDFYSLQTRTRAAIVSLLF